MSSMSRLRNNAIALEIEEAGPDRPAVQRVVSEIRELPSPELLVTTTSARDGYILGLCLTES